MCSYLKGNQKQDTRNTIIMFVKIFYSKVTENNITNEANSEVYAYLIHIICQYNSYDTNKKTYRCHWHIGHVYMDWKHIHLSLFDSLLQ